MTSVNIKMRLRLFHICMTTLFENQFITPKKDTINTNLVCSLIALFQKVEPVQCGRVQCGSVIILYC